MYCLLDGCLKLPVEHMEFGEVVYWEELCDIMEWSKKRVTSTLHICWAAQAGLYYHYEIQKHPMKEKLSGVYRHRTENRKTPLIRSMDDYVYCPHSRNTEIRKEDVEKHPNLKILAHGDDCGLLLLMDLSGRQIFVQEASGV